MVGGRQIDQAGYRMAGSQMTTIDGERAAADSRPLPLSPAGFFSSPLSITRIMAFSLGPPMILPSLRLWKLFLDGSWRLLRRSHSCARNGW